MCFFWGEQNIKLEQEMWAFYLIIFVGRVRKQDTDFNNENKCSRIQKSFWSHQLIYPYAITCVML